MNHYAKYPYYTISIIENWLVFLSFFKKNRIGKNVGNNNTFSYIINIIRKLV